MEGLVNDMEHFWSEAMQTLQEEIEKGAHEVADLPSCELGLLLPALPCPQHGNPLND